MWHAARRSKFAVTSKNLFAEPSPGDEAPGQKEAHEKCVVQQHHEPGTWRRSLRLRGIANGVLAVILDVSLVLLHMIWWA